MLVKSAEAIMFTFTVSQWDGQLNFCEINEICP